MAEGKGLSEMYRNTSEELFLRSLMESSIGMPMPSMEMLGFKNISSHHNFRTDSEELFKSWLTNGENHGHNSSNIAHRTRQASRRLSTELAGLTNQQPGIALQKKRSNDVLFTQNNLEADGSSGDLNQLSMRNAVEKSVQASNLYLAKAWFHSSQPMTRSRSSELRKRYAAMQSTQTTLGHGDNNLKEEFANPNGFNDLPMNGTANHFGAFMSPSNSSSSTFNTSQIGEVDKVSSVVSMLKGTLERKKLGNQIEKETVEDSANAIYYGQQVTNNASFHQGQGKSINDITQTFQEISSGEIKDAGVFQTVEDLEMEGFVNPILNPIQFSTISREPSQSESSAAAPVVSSGFDACDGPSNSSQTLSICESSRKQVGNNLSSENGSKAKDIRERIIENLKDDRKRRGLVRYGSVTSVDSVDKGDTTKKRRVERSRKMAEAKERNSTPAIPSDMQSVLKRCENLEKEVRSLKLNLSFMNRKDSEQTKQIEELQKRNEELTDEKERLLEEMERMLSESGKM
ncbi:hypothetical protein JCGZ_02768 [Jatropha curcas]|uniref:Uncharacterized protein n=1 Tax=Jatropha curcas TaxID=180498 RepID=A0A067KXS8_JATCU|nr:protein CYCLOPS [Jatropha curcas]KDP39748.1 hypothetical protein JCGZ_02768 [Jatropha curcas]